MGSKAAIFGLFLLCVTLGVARSDWLARAVSTDKAKVELTFWNGFTGPDGRTMLGIVRKFNDADPSVDVTMQRLAWATYYNKLIVSAVDGRGPDVFIVHASMLERIARSGAIDSLDDLFAADPLLRAEFSPALLKLINLGDDRERLFGLPLDVHLHGLYLNREMLKRAGVVDETGEARAPTNREEFLAAARAMKRDEDQDGRPEFWGLGLGNWTYNFYCLIPQFGGQLVDSCGNPTLDHPGNVAALEFLAGLLHEHQVIPPPEGGVAGWIGFRQQRVGMIIDGVYMVGDLKRLDGHPYIAAPLPQIGPNPGTFGDSHVLCVRSGLSKEKRAAAIRFVRFVSDHSLEWADAGQVPARLSVRESPAFGALPVQFQFGRQLDHVMYLPRTPSVVELGLHVGAAVERAIRGRMSAAEALRVANEDYARFLQRDREDREAAP